MVYQQDDYLVLLGRIANIDPSEGLAKALPGLATEPIEQNDAVALLLLAEHAMRARQWQAAAQLFAHMMVSSFVQRDTEANVVGEARRFILLVAPRPAQFQSCADLLLYGHRRLTAALRGDGMQQPHIRDWTVAAVSRLLRSRPDRSEAIGAALVALLPDNNRITKSYLSEIGPARALLVRSLSVADTDNVQVWVANNGRRRLLLGGAIIVIAAGAYLLRRWFAFPQLSGLLDGSRPCSLLNAALLAWPFLLLATWIFAFYESKRTHTLNFISPIHLIASGIVSGEIIPFSRDWFFHIFQFIWVGLLIIAWFLFREYQELPSWLPLVWKPAAQNTLLSFTQSLTVPFLPGWPASGGLWSDFRALLFSDVFALAVAICVCFWSIRRQRNIQQQRSLSGVNIYWWDYRISPTEAWIRLIMVGVDMFFATFLMIKILMTLLVVYELVITNSFAISYFSPDGVGGLKHFTDMLMYLSWAVFLFGMFVFASLYLHWNLREYRTYDFGLVVVYGLVVALAVVPLGFLESTLSGERDALLKKLVTAAPPDKLEETAKYVQNVDLVRDWRVSAVNVGILGNPVLPLGFQFVVVLVQFFGRAGKLPKLPIPGLSDEKGSKATHDAA